MFNSPTALARISHHPTTATVPCHALWAFYSVRVLDIVSTMPAGPCAGTYADNIMPAFGRKTHTGRIL